MRKRALGISGVLTDVSKGIEGSQIDLLISRRDHVINLCEMKYSDRPYVVTKSVDRDITHKLGDFRAATGSRDALHPTLVTTYGLAQGLYAGSFQSVVTAGDLFAQA